MIITLLVHSVKYIKKFNKDLGRYIYYILYNVLSLSTIVLNSRDWSEIVWLHEISRFKINLAIGFIRKKKTTGMHWLGYNDAVSWLTKRKLEYFSLQPILKFSKFTCISSACRPASLPASLP